MRVLKVRANRSAPLDAEISRGAPHTLGMRTTSVPSSPSLRREVGLGGAVALGLGSMIGTGVFVSIGIAAGIAGPAVIIAIVVAAFVALCNAMSSAQLAAIHPVSGGSYEYGYLRLHPAAGFTAGWMFLCAKSASAATAALGFSAYLLGVMGADSGRWGAVVAVAAVCIITVLVLSGIRRSNVANMVIVAVSVGTLLALVVACFPAAMRSAGDHLLLMFPDSAGPEQAGGTGGGWGAWWEGMLHSAALMFVAFTGYGRLATLGEEVHEPRKTIPRAILVTIALTAALYIAVAGVAVGVLGSEALGRRDRGDRGDAGGSAEPCAWLVAGDAGDGTPRGYAAGGGPIGRGEHDAVGCCAGRGRGDRTAGRSGEYPDSVVVQRVYGADLLRDYECCRAAAWGG
jgi:amino acid transporter